MKKKLIILLPLLLLIFTGCIERSPVIDSIYPRIGILGENLTITGQNFGREQGESFITIAGAQPTMSSYLSWENNQIILIIPEFAEPGLIYVHRGGRRSNPALFANRATMPLRIRGDDLFNEPRVNSIEPGITSIGSVITILGNNFGSSRENSAVWFSWDAETAPSAPVGLQARESVEAFDIEFGYELWSEREIRVRVPDGAVSGNVELRTSRGNSRPVFLEIGNAPGSKTLMNKRSYTFSYSVDIRVENSFLPNTLYLWLPGPASSASQRNAELLTRNMEPYVENYRGTSLFQFTDLLPLSTWRITLSYVVDVYQIHTNIRPYSIIQNVNSPIHTIHTMASSLIPSDHQDIRTRSNAIVGRETNPYNKARLIYNWLLANANINTETLSGGVLEALEEQAADSYRASLLFCALARAANIPAIPVTGVLIDRNRNTTRHHWAEFWIDSFGWVPVDPSLGAGAAPLNFVLPDDYSAFYFGNSDNQRIAFSRGEVLLSQMDPRGRLAGRTREFAMQNLWEEAVGGLESYSSLWGDVTITGMYAQ